MEDLAIEVQTMTEVAKQYEWYLTAQDGDTEIDAFRRIVQEENLGLELVRKENSQVLREIANLMKKNILDE